MPYILVVITYLGGSAWGPVVSQQEYLSAGTCEAARKGVIHGISEMNKTNLIGGNSFRDIVKMDCVRK